MTKLRIRQPIDQSLQPINIKICEEHYGATFVGDFCLKANGGGWSEIPLAIFYQPNPNISLGHTHYFGLMVDQFDRLVITNGESAFEEPIQGIVADNGEVIYSRYRHDYVTSEDGSVWIDGGRDYTRRGPHGQSVKLVIKDDKLVIDKLIVDPMSINNPEEELNKISTLTLR